MVNSAPFARFAELCERLAATPSRLERVSLVADFLHALTPEETEVATRWLVGRAFPEAQGRRLSLGGRAIWEALAHAGASVAVAGWEGAEDFGEVVRQLMAAAAERQPTLSFNDLISTFAAIAAARGSGSRRQRIA